MRSKNVHLDIKPELWKEFKIACVWYDISMKDTLIQHIQNIVSDHKKALSEFYIPKIYIKTKEKK